MKKRFKNLRNGIILDNKTGLQWQAEVQKRIPWQKAMEYAKNLRLGEYRDWRLPTRLELEGLLNLDKYNPASDFPNMPSDWFWSSSSYAYYLPYAWLVSFNFGYVSNSGKADYYYARCVRSGS